MKTNEIPKEIHEIMKYLSESFAKSIQNKSSIYDEQDLYNDLVVLYLENLENGKVADPSDKNQWFIFFKSRLLNKYKTVSIEYKNLKLYQLMSRI